MKLLFSLAVSKIVIARAEAINSNTNATNATNFTNSTNSTININGTEPGKLQLDQKVFLNNATNSTMNSTSLDFVNENTNSTVNSTVTNTTIAEPAIDTTNSTNVTENVNITANATENVNFDYNATCGALDINVLPDTEDIDEEEEGCFVYSCVVEEELKKRREACEKHNKCELENNSANDIDDNAEFFKKFQNFTMNSANFAMNSTNSTATNSTSENLSVLKKEFLINSSTLPDSEIRNVSLASDGEFYSENENNATSEIFLPAFNDFTLTSFLLDSGVLRSINHNSTENSTSENSTISSTMAESKNHTMNFTRNFNSTEVSADSTNSDYDAVHFGEFFFNNAPAPRDFFSEWRKDAKPSDHDLEVVADDIAEDNVEAEEESYLAQKLEEFYSSFNRFLPADKIVAKNI